MPQNDYQAHYEIVRKARENWGDEVIKDLELIRTHENIFTYKMTLSNDRTLNVLWYTDNGQPNSLVSGRNITLTYPHDTDDPYAFAEKTEKDGPILGVNINAIESRHEYNSKLSVTCNSRFIGKIEAKLLTARLSYMERDMLDPDADKFAIVFKIEFNQDLGTITNEELHPMVNLLCQGLERYGYHEDTSSNAERAYSPTGISYVQVYHSEVTGKPTQLQITCVATVDV